MLTDNWPRDICAAAGATGADCGNYWTAVSALATASAAIVALIAAIIAVALPPFMASRERQRRDKERVAVIREVCSAVDQIIAYHEALLALCRAEPVYHEGFAACDRIGVNAITLAEMLAVLKTRAELTDGAIYSAIGGWRIAEAVISCGRGPYGQTSNDWPNRISRLESVQTLVGTVAARVRGVRSHAGLKPSTAAAAIRGKYGPVIAEIVDARANDRGPVIAPLDADHY